MSTLQLSPHFTLTEFTRSSTAARYSIDNHLDPTNAAHRPIIDNLRNLCVTVLEPLRLHVQQPVIISSGYRCPDLNRAVGGSRTSQHMKGEAADIYLDDTPKLLSWFHWLQHSVPFDQLILERSTPTSMHFWIHISCYADPSRNRHQVFDNMTKHR